MWTRVGFWYGLIGAMALCNVVNAAQAPSGGETGRTTDFASRPRYQLNQKLPSIVSTTTWTVYDVLVSQPFALMSRMGPLVGFEEKRYAAGQSPRRFEFAIENMTLREVLDTIVAKDPDYVWRDVEGVICIRPRVPLADDALNAIVSRFKVTDMDLYGAVERLLNQANSKALQSQSMRFWGERERAVMNRINLDVKDVTVRGCLNQIVGQDGYHDWRYVTSAGARYSAAPAPLRPAIEFLERPDFMPVRSERMKNRREERLRREGWTRKSDGGWYKFGNQDANARAEEERVLRERILREDQRLRQERKEREERLLREGWIKHGDDWFKPGKPKQKRKIEEGK